MRTLSAGLCGIRRRAQENLSAALSNVSHKAVLSNVSHEAVSQRYFQRTSQQRRQTFRIKLFVSHSAKETVIKMLDPILHHVYSVRLWPEFTKFQRCTHGCVACNIRHLRVAHCHRLDHCHRAGYLSAIFRWSACIAYPLEDSENLLFGCLIARHSEMLLIPTSTSTGNVQCARGISCRIAVPGVPKLLAAWIVFIWL